MATAKKERGRPRYSIPKLQEMGIRSLTPTAVLEDRATRDPMSLYNAGYTSDPAAPIPAFGRDRFGPTIPPPSSALEDRFTRSPREIYNAGYTEDPVHQVLPAVPEVKGENWFLDPWREAHDDIMKKFGPWREAVVNPDADPNMQTTPGGAMDPGAPGFPIVDENIPPLTLNDLTRNPYEEQRGPDYLRRREHPTETGVPATPPPPDEEEEAPPAAVEGPPALTPFPGTTSETATGALTLEGYDALMKDRYPDLDFSNPKQAEADANARRDLDRTAMLAQLSMAAGMLKGAGAGWAGMGEGFAGAAGTYDKGFQKYQQALQDSADRYGKQQEAQMTYDTARRKAALDMWTTTEESGREDRRTRWTEENKRFWEFWKEGEQSKREEAKLSQEGAKLSQEGIKGYFAPLFKALEPPTDTSTIGPDQLAEMERKRAAVSAAYQKSIIAGRIVAPEDVNVDMAD